MRILHRGRESNCDTVAAEAKLFDFESEPPFVNPASSRIAASHREEQGTEARQRDIYESHRHRAFSIAYYMTGNEVEAEKVLAGTFVRAFHTALEPSGQEVDLALLDELRQNSYLQPALVSAPDALRQPLAVEQNVKRTDLEEALQYLPPQERILFLLRDVEGYSAAAIAQLLEMTEPHIQRGILTARIRLRAILAEAQARNIQAA
jgi:RNA polymerase sigma-70 factor (ECF subfamily)